MSTDPIPALSGAPHLWLLIIDALIEVVRAALPGEWTRYGMIAGELLGIASPVAAARQRLGQVRSHKLLEAEDYGFLDQVLRPARAAPHRSPGEAQRIRLAQEALRLEERFTVALLDELRAEPKRWEGEATSVRDGRGRPIAPVTWHVTGLTFDLVESAVQPGAAPRLLGVRLRRVATQPVAVPAPPDTGDQPPKPPAKDIPKTPADIPAERWQAIWELYVKHVEEVRVTHERPPKRYEDLAWDDTVGVRQRETRALRKAWRNLPNRC